MNLTIQISIYFSFFLFYRKSDKLSNIIDNQLKYIPFIGYNKIV